MRKRVTCRTANHPEKRLYISMKAETNAAGGEGKMKFEISLKDIGGLCFFNSCMQLRFPYAKLYIIYIILHAQLYFDAGCAFNFICTLISLCGSRWH